MSISAVLIVKNEEELLGRCLDSIQEADEIIVCDTGSQDETVAIAQSFGATIITFDWCDDFAVARNFAKAHANNDWVLSIDADEFLVEGHFERLRAASKDAPGPTLGICLKGEGSENIHWVPRLFRKEINWIGKVHEVPEIPACAAVDATIIYGYSPAHNKDPDRTIRILTSLEKPGPRELFYLAREYYYRSDWEKAIETYLKYLEVATWMPERADAWLLLSHCFWVSGQAEEARTACAQAIVNNANFREALEFMAEMSWDGNAERWRSFAELADNSNVLFIRN